MCMHSSKQQYGQQSSVSLPSWLSSSMQSNAERANALAQTPTQTFAGPSFTPITGAQTGAMNATAGITGFAPSQVSAGSLGSTDLSPYLNPFTQDVIDTTGADIDRSTAIAREQAKGNAAAVGAFGGDRQGIEQAEIAGQGIRAKANVGAQLRAQNFGQAQAAATGDISRALTADTQNQMAGIQGAGLNLSAAGQLFGQGETEREAQDQGRQFDYAEFLRQQADPYNKLSWAQGVTTGAAPFFSTQNTTGYSPGPSPFAQGIGGASAIIGALGKLGGFGKADGGRIGYAAGGDVAAPSELVRHMQRLAAGGDVDDGRPDVSGMGITLDPEPDAPRPVQLAALLPDVAKRRDALMDAYPGLRVTSESRGPSRDSRVQNSQHTHDRAFDLDIGAVPEDKRPALVTDLTGGRFGAVGGLGMYGEEKPNMLHVDYRPGTRAAWGPNRSHTSLDQTPGYFREAVGNWRGRPVGIQVADAGNVATDAPAPRPGDPVAVELPRSPGPAGITGAPAEEMRENPYEQEWTAIQDEPDRRSWRDPDNSLWDFLLTAGGATLASRAPGGAGIGEGIVAGSRAVQANENARARRLDQKDARLGRLADRWDTREASRINRDALRQDRREALAMRDAQAERDRELKREITKMQENGRTETREYREATIELRRREAARAEQDAKDRADRLKIDRDDRRVARGDALWNAETDNARAEVTVRDEFGQPKPFTPEQTAAVSNRAGMAVAQTYPDHPRAQAWARSALPNDRWETIKNLPEPDLRKAMAERGVSEAEQARILAAARVRRMERD